MKTKSFSSQVATEIVLHGFSETLEKHNAEVALKNKERSDKHKANMESLARDNPAVVEREKNFDDYLDSHDRNKNRVSK